MNKIKSERAKKVLGTLSLNSANVEYCLKKGVINGSLKVDIEDIVCLAEQEADERAKKAFCKATCNDGLYCEERNCHDMRAFIESLNNGGQSDE